MARAEDIPPSVPPLGSLWTVWELYGSYWLADALESYHGWMWPCERIEVLRPGERDGQG